MPAPCAHLARISRGHPRVKPSAPGCEECLANGGVWVHLRLCLQCGHVGCCDSSPNHHATRHFHETAHPVVKSFEPGEHWAWCYEDGAFLEEIPANPGEEPAEHIAAPW